MVKKIINLTDDELSRICNKNGNRPCKKCILYLSECRCMRSPDVQVIKNKLNQEIHI